MSEGEILVRVEGVSKKFCRSLKKSLFYGVSDILSELNPLRKNGAPAARSGSGDQGEAPGNQASTPNPTLRKDEFWAVKDVSFELRRGECLGLIGRNGAGKTTLLKMLNGLIKPDHGRIEMRGRVGALIALGAGFNPILTGRENIYVNGSVLGLTRREVDAKMEQIIDFADIREFINSPVQSYSSGMQVRLGFAVATAMEPDVLLLDEVLAVGDAAFRNKCYYRVGQLRKNAAVVFVSHNMESVAHVCDKVLVMEAGAAVFQGGIPTGMQEYHRLNKVSANGGEAFVKILPPLVEAECVPSKTEIQYGDSLAFDFKYRSTEKIANPCLRFCFYDGSGIMVAEWDSHRNNFPVTINSGRGEMRVGLGPILLKAGIYYLGIQLHDTNFLLIPYWSFKTTRLEVGGTPRGYAPYQITSTSNPE